MRKGWVLIVEDNAGDARLLVKLLARIEAAAGYELVHAEDGEAALAMIADGSGRGDPSLVLLDLNLPGITGHEFLQGLREDLGPQDRSRGGAELVLRPPRHGPGPTRTARPRICRRRQTSTAHGRLPPPSPASGWAPGSSRG